MKTIKMTPLDFVILLCLLVFSFTPWIVSGIEQFNKQAVTYQAQLRVDKTVIKTFDLAKDQNYTFREKDGDINLIEIKNGAIRIKEANCPDQVCIRRGWISKGGETIVCLPHKLVIEVFASDGSQEGSVIQ